MQPTEFKPENQILLLQNNNNNNNNHHHHNKSNNSQMETSSYKLNDDNQEYTRASRYTPTLIYSETTDVDRHYILDNKMNHKNISTNNHDDDDDCGTDQTTTATQKANEMILFQELTPKKRRTESLLSSSLSFWDEKWLLFHNNNHYKHHHHHHMSPKMIVVEKESRSYCPTMSTTNNNNNNDDVCDVVASSSPKYMDSSIHLALFDDSTRQRTRKKNKKDNVHNDDDSDGNGEGHGEEPRSASILSSTSMDFIIKKDTRNHQRHHHHHHQHQDHQQHPNSYRILTSSTNQRFYDQFIIVLLVFILYFSCSSSPSTSTHHQYVNAIRSIRIMAPDYIFYGDPIWLNCSVVDLDYNQIYSIKWFKDNDEMYRFITADELPTTFYETPGIVIDEQRSNYGNLYISRTGFRKEADFRCEVLAENDFNTVIQIKKIKVYYIPRDGQPIIVGKKSHFGPNEPVNLTCTSPMSIPAARLVVNLNGNSLIGNNQIQTKTYHRHFENGQSSTSVNVQFPGSWLQAKKINQFECTSSIIHRFNRTASLRLELRIDHSASDNHTAFFPVLEQSNHYSDRLTPRIENHKEKYEIGDQISLRCISAQYKPMPELYWLKDGQQIDAQYLDYKQNDYHINGFVRLDLKYRLSLQNHKNLNQQQQQQQQESHHNNGHAKHSFHQRHIQHHNGKRNNNNNGNKKIDPETKPSSMTIAPIDSYHFECVQVLSNVISVSSEVVQLYGTSSSSMSSSNNHESEQSLLHHGNSVEAVKSLIGNGTTLGGITTLVVVAMAVFLSITFQS